MIALALSGAVWTVALLVLALCVALRTLYVLGQREQARRAAAATTAPAQDAYWQEPIGGGMRVLSPAEFERHQAREAIREQDPVRAARTDAVDPL